VRALIYFIDTSIFLEVELGQEKKNEAKALLNKILKGEVKVVTTDFNIDAVALVMQRYKAKPSDIRKFFMNMMIFDGLTIYEVNLIDRILATKLMENHKLRFDDALNFFVMKSLGLNEIISFDTDFDKLPGIKRLEPEEALG
jgi:predicted nucleic acid-binding protein